MRRTLLSFIAIVLIGSAAPARATVILELDLPHLVGRADAIVLGKAVRSESLWSEDGRHIVTDTTLEIEESVKGEPSGRTIVIRRMGGTVGDIGMLVNGVAELRPGKRYLVFSEQRRGHRYVVGMKQGLYSVERDAVGRKMVRARLDGLTLARQTASGLRMLEPQSTSPQLLGDFIKQIRETITQCAKEKQRCQSSE